MTRLAEIARPWDGNGFQEWLVIDLTHERDYVSIGVEYLAPDATERGSWQDCGITIDVANIDAIVTALRAAQSESKEKP